MSPIQKHSLSEQKFPDFLFLLNWISWDRNQRHLEFCCFTSHYRSSILALSSQCWEMGGDVGNGAEENKPITRWLTSRPKVSSVEGSVMSAVWDPKPISACGFALRTLLIDNRSQVFISFSLPLYKHLWPLPRLADAHLLWWQISLAISGASLALLATTPPFPAQMPFPE